MEPMHSSASDAAQRRVFSDEDPMLQAAVEQIAVMYSIRSILLWMLVIVPIAVAVAVVLLFIVA